MARTAAGTALTREHRRQQLAIRAATMRDLLTLWAVVDPRDLGATFDRFSGAAAVAIRARNRDSAGLASRYFAAFRAAEGIGGRALPAIAEAPPLGAIRDSLRATGLLGILNARRAGLPLQAAAENGYVRASGSGARLALAGGRETLLQSVRRDTARPRWQRITSAEPCDFCAMLAGRGAVYVSEETGGFEAHDHCSCTAEPVY